MRSNLDGMENDPEKIFAYLREEVSNYAGLRLRLLKLMAIERAAGFLSALSHSLVLLLLAFFTILFLFIALGFYLGDVLGSVALGFLIVGGIYLVLTLVFVVAKSGIRMQLMNAFVDALQTNDADDDNDEENKSADSARTTAGGETNDPQAVQGIGE